MKAEGRWQELKGQFQAWLAQGAKDLHNHVVPAVPQFVHGVDQPGTPLNMSPAAERPSFEETMASQKPPTLEASQEQGKGMEL